MVRWKSIIILIVIVGLFAMVRTPSAYAQGAKIQRKTAMLTVQPQIVIGGYEINALVQPYDDRVLLRVSLIRIASGEVLDRQSAKGNSPVQSLSLNAPEGTEGQLRVVLEARRNLEWTPIATQDVLFFPGYWDEFCALVERAEKIESQAKDSNPAQLRAAWAALAYAEDLIDRLKTEEAGEAWNARPGLQTLRTKVELLESGKDPFGNAPGYQLRGYRSPLNGEVQLYSTYVPKGYGADPNQQWPLVIMLHGAWSNHHLALRRVMGQTNNRGEDDVSAKRYMPPLPDVPYVVVAPNGFETSWYKGCAEDDVWQVLEEAKSLFNIDPNRIYLTGLSMGGMGTGMLGLNHPDRFAAIAPVCGFFQGPFEAGEPPRPSFQQRLVACAAPMDVAENALHLPVKLMHGDKDPVVPVKNSIDLNAKLKELGYRTEIEVYPGVGHDAWVSAYENARIFEWFSQFQRDPAPRQVIYKTGDPRGGSCYWVSIEEPAKIRQIARIEAEIAENAVAVKTDNVQRLSLSIPDSLISAGSAAKVSINDKPVFEGEISRSLRFVLESGEWKLTSAELPARWLPSKNGMFAAFYDRHVFAYGTAGDAEENREAQSLAVSQSMPESWVDVQYPVLPETALTPDVLKNNHVVLISTLKGSSFLQNYIKSLPIQVDGDRIEIAGRTVNPDQALAFIAPNPANANQYLLVYTAATLEGLQAVRYTLAGAGALFANPPGDFAVFGKDGKPAWGGLFDKNWQVDEAGDF